MAKPAKKSKNVRPDYCAALYNLGPNTEKGLVLRGVLKGLEIPIRTITVERLNDPVGSIAGLVGFRPSLTPFAGEAPQQEFLLLCNIPNALIDKLLLAMRESGVGVSDKAMVTKFNKTWPLAELMGQVRAERAELAARAGLEKRQEGLETND